MKKILKATHQTYLELCFQVFIDAMVSLFWKLNIIMLIIEIMMTKAT